MCGDSFFEDRFKEEEEEIRRSVFLGPASAAARLVGHKTAPRTRRGGTVRRVRRGGFSWPGLAVCLAFLRPIHRGHCCRTVFGSSGMEEGKREEGTSIKYVRFFCDFWRYLLTYLCPMHYTGALLGMWTWGRVHTKFWQSP